MLCGISWRVPHVPGSLVISGRLLCRSQRTEGDGTHGARSMESLQQVFYRRGLGQRLAALIVTAIMVPLSQVRLACLGSHTCRFIVDSRFCLVMDFSSLIKEQCGVLRQ